MGQGETATEIRDYSSDRKYWIQVPQIVWAKSRSPYDISAWLVIKMIAGETGECFLSTPELAILARMSDGKFSGCRQHLLEVGLLEGELRRDPGYPQPVWHLRIPDLWPENMAWRQQLGHSLKDRVAFCKRQKLEAAQARLSQKQDAILPPTDNPHSVSNQPIIIEAESTSIETDSDYLAMIANQASKGDSWTIPFAAGGAAGKDSLMALEAFCATQGTQAISLREDVGRNWIKELARIATFWGVTMEALANTIRYVPSTKGEDYDISWKDWPSPFSNKDCTKGFGADIGPLLRKLGPQGQRLISDERPAGRRKILNVDTGQETWIAT